MGHARTRFQHKAGHRTDGDVSTHAGFVHHNECAVDDIQITSFDIDNRDAVLDGERF
jgi:hypothetical protein